jgi:hypothetical protein
MVLNHARLNNFIFHLQPLDENADKFRCRGLGKGADMCFLFG